MLERLCKNYNKLNAFVLGCIAFLLLTVQLVHAQSGSEGVTAEEKAIFAFFRAANIAPDYEFWIKSSYSFRTLEEHKRQKHYINEMMRLGRGYSLYDKERDVLIIKADIFTRYMPDEDDKPARIMFRFFNAVGNDIPSFNFPYGEDIVSLVIDRLSVFADLKLRETQRDALLPKIPYEKDDFDAKLEVHVRVSRADYENPVISPEKKRQWLMVGDVAYLKCVLPSFYEEDVVLWDYLAPWYEEEFQRKQLPEEAKYPHPYDLFKD